MNNLDYKIYTDGACLRNPGPGGWAVLIISTNQSKEKKFGGESYTTNNRMELTAVIQALKTIPIKSTLALYTDSKYVINGINTWIVNWKKSKWIGSNKKEVKNKDLWIELDTLIQDFNIQWNWVKGHSGDTNNEVVDKLARNEALKLDLS